MRFEKAPFPAVKINTIGKFCFSRKVAFEVRKSQMPTVPWVFLTGRFMKKSLADLFAG